MTWTYTGNPATNSLSAVRWLVGDTDSNRKLVTDEEINYELTASGGVVTTAARAVINVLMTKYSMMGYTKIGAFIFDATKIVKTLQEALDRLDESTSFQKGMWYAGGISISDKSGVKSNTDRVPPRFSRDMHENKNTEHTE